MFTLGSRVGQYEIVSRLKAGGMATLFVGRREGPAGFAREVAIKIVHPDLASSPQFVRMFLDEALLSSRIQHPNVVHVEELGEADGTYYLVMEYVRGYSLAQVLDQLALLGRRLSPDMATSIAIKVADGLHAAHETRGDHGELLNVVHRDVSPQNILLAKQGHVKLIDFGIAKARMKGRRTTVGSLKGKLRYMSPEQAMGQPVDRRTDVFALAIVLWEMLTMRRCFEADTDADLIQRVRNPVVDPPSSIVPEVPEALDRVVLAALAPDRNDRPATAQELRRKLADAMPRALALEASDLADLIAATLPEEEKAAAPEERAPTQDATVDLRVAPRRKPAEQVLETLTHQSLGPPPAFGADAAPDQPSETAPAARQESPGPPPGTPAARAGDRGQPSGGGLWASIRRWWSS